MERIMGWFIEIGRIELHLLMRKELCKWAVFKKMEQTPNPIAYKYTSKYCRGFQDFSVPLTEESTPSSGSDQ
jgi:hypothetical protein